VVSAYAFSAGLSGFLTAGFADRFDRKKLLLFGARSPSYPGRL
jgi:predicted MFS family arabinose efflux permease